MLFVIFLAIIVIFQFIVVLSFLIRHTSPIRETEDMEISLPTVDGVMVSTVPNDERIIIVVDM